MYYMDSSMYGNHPTQKSSQTAFADNKWAYFFVVVYPNKKLKFSFKVPFDPEYCETN